MLFNKNNNGSEELFELTGTFHASTDFRSVKADVAAAEMDVTDLIGEDIMQKAQEAYDTGTDNDLVDAVRLPVAGLAVAYYARKTGLSVGETGRKIKVDENEKVPFEWMIDRDNLEMIERYYRAMDLLFRFLEKKNDLNFSPPHEALTVVKTIQDFERVYPIHGSRYTLHKMFPLLSEAESILKRKTTANIDSDELKPAAARFIVLTALMTALKRWSLSVFPAEVARQFSPSHEGNRETQPASIDEIRWCIEQFEQQVNDALLEIHRLTGDLPSSAKLPDNRPEKKFFTTQ